MALKYGNNQVTQVRYTQRHWDGTKYVVDVNNVELKALKCLSPNNYYDYVKSYTYTVTSSQWDLISEVTWTRTKCYNQAETTHSGTITQNANTFTVYWGDEFTITTKTNSNYHIGYSSDKSNNEQKTFTTEKITIDGNSTSHNIDDIYPDKYYAKVKGIDYDQEANEGHIRGVYLDYNADEITDTTDLDYDGYFNYGSTVYAYYILLDDGATTTPGTYVGTTQSGYKVYRSDGVTITKDYDFGTYSLSTKTYTLRFVEPDYFSWNAEGTYSVYWGAYLTRSSISDSSICITIEAGPYAENLGLLDDSETTYYNGGNYPTSNSYYTFDNYALNVTTDNGSTLPTNVKTKVTTNYTFTPSFSIWGKAVIYANCSTLDSNYFRLYGSLSLYNTPPYDAIDLTKSGNELEVRYPNTGYIWFGINATSLVWNDGSSIGSHNTTINVKQGSSTIQATYRTRSTENGYEWCWFYWTVKGSHSGSAQDINASYTNLYPVSSSNQEVREKNIGEAIMFGRYDEWYDDDSGYDSYFRIINSSNSTMLVEYLKLYDSSSGSAWKNVSSGWLEPGSHWDVNINGHSNSYFVLSVYWNGKQWYYPKGTGTWTYDASWGTTAAYEGARIPMVNLGFHKQN